MTFSEGNQLFVCDLMLFWMKQTLIYFSLQKYGTGNGLSNIIYTSAESFQLQILLLHQSIYISRVGLSSLNDGWQTIKKKYMMSQIPNKMLKRHASLDSNLPNLKDLLIQKGA